MKKSLRVMIAVLLAALPACEGSAPPVEPPAPADTVPAAPPAVMSPEAERHYQLALELESAGRYDEAQAEVELALEGGGGRDAKLLAAKLAILRDDLDAASRLLEPLSKDATDAPVLYNLGLIAQKRGRYNSARSRYLAALRADPSYNAARFNLALLTWNAGVKEEAEHHARKFIEAAPDDPHAAQLRQLILEPVTTPPANGTNGAATPEKGAAAVPANGAATPAKGAVAVPTNGAAVPPTSTAGAQARAAGARRGG